MVVADSPPHDRLDDAIARLVTEYRRGVGASARVLLVTIFGDACLPRRQPISVGPLARLVEPFGINERLVRTSLHRLAAEGLVSSERLGRLAFYSVSLQAVDTFLQADHRIYHRPELDWDGQWTIAVIDPRLEEGVEKRQLEQELRWLGLRSTTPGTYLSPTASPIEASAVAKRLGLELAVLTRAPLESVATLDGTTLAELVTPMDALRKDYEAYIERFSPLTSAPGWEHDPEAAFVLRALLIDSWRRLALRDLDLPHDLLPGDWPAAEAFTLTGQLYRRAYESSERHIDAVAGPTDTPAHRPDRFEAD